MPVAENQNKHRVGRRLEAYLYVFLCIFLIASVWALHEPARKLVSEQSVVDRIPVIVFRLPHAEARPAVVIAHGFAGSQQLMLPMAATLARNGYVAITFDFAGHGRNSVPMSGGIKNMEKSTNHLLSEIDAIVSFARAATGTNGSVALIGHSMAAELVVQYAMQKQGIDATIALSLFGKAVTAQSPRNLLVITGAWEPRVLRDAGFRIAGLAAGGDAQERVTYGDFANGTARRHVLAAGAEHIGVIYSRDALRESVNWLNDIYKRTSDGFVESRGKWIALLILSLVLLARPALSWLPKASERKRDIGFGGWRMFAIPALAPMALTPLLLWKAPTDFLPILLGDYLAVHFGLYGLLTLAALTYVQRTRNIKPAYQITSWNSLLLAAACVAIYQIAFLGLPIDRYVTSFAPDGWRWLIIPAMFAGTAIYFLADAAVIRSFPGLNGAYALTKLCFAISLAIAVGLNPPKLFFLAIIVPVICLFFVLYGLINRWTLRSSGEPYAAALGNSIALAWAISVTFPIVN
jgi:hypothetical protein